MEIEIRFWYESKTNGRFYKTFTLGEIMNGDPFEVLTDSPLLRSFKMLDKSEVYTGLKDKNDKKIFEGDILKYTDITEYPAHSETKDVIKIVEFKRGKFNASMFAGISEIIGNITDNPELLEQ